MIELNGKHKLSFQRLLSKIFEMCKWYYFRTMSAGPCMMKESNTLLVEWDHPKVGSSLSLVSFIHFVHTQGIVDDSCILTVVFLHQKCHQMCVTCFYPLFLIVANLVDCQSVVVSGFDNRALKLLHFVDVRLRMWASLPDFDFVLNLALYLRSSIPMILTSSQSITLFSHIWYSGSSWKWSRFMPIEGQAYWSHLPLSQTSLYPVRTCPII